MILAFDTATDRLVLALRTETRDWLAPLTTDYRHGSELFPAINALLSQAGVTRKDLTGLACSLGPGSFTGLRIGMAAAKGLAEGLDIPLVAVSTLEALGRSQSGPVAVIMNARKQRFYWQCFRDGVALDEARDWSWEQIKAELLSLQEGKEPWRLLCPRLDFPTADLASPWPLEESPGWAGSFLDIAQEKLTRGEKLGPHEGALYVRKSDAELDRISGFPRKAGNLNPPG